MSSMTLKQPRQIFSGPRPPPPLWPQPIDSSPRPPVVPPSSFLPWTNSRDNGSLSFLSFDLRSFQRGLRSVQKRKIPCPMKEFKESTSTNLSPNEYLDLLLEPIASVFNQLRFPRLEPLEYSAFKLDSAIYGAIFSSMEFVWPEQIGSIMVLALADSLFEPEGHISSPVACALSQALEYDPIAPSAIIVTNFKDLAVFFPPSRTNPQPSFERVSTTQFSLALQVISAACVYGTLPGSWIARPDREFEFVLPEGPPQNPDRPMLSDDEVFATHHRHSDFDIPTLLRNKAKALQFFRWHDHIRCRCSRLVVNPNDVLHVVVNTLDSIHPPLHPLYPFNTAELPADTIAHLKETQRPSPLQTTGILDHLMVSKSFAVEIQDVISAGSERGICTVYRCQITLIDNQPVTSSPNLCLKLFDDRFQVLEGEPTEEEANDTNKEYLSCWFHLLIMSETFITNEILAYNKLRPVQGSIIPWFYGAHLFTLPDGTVLYGLLMEYIEGQEINSNTQPALSHERQIKMVESCRHAVHALDVGDISQRDWHSGQILLYTNPITQVNHAVLVDFGLTTQTYQEENLNYLGNYGGMLTVLVYQNCMLNRSLIWKHFEEPDDWDPIDDRMDVNIFYNSYYKEN
ncbi:hypothetical protein C0995_015939 [Termitomyces sp. Mi166|nr:hypothetical protein C0995_015939 [Termitomyces sp. Mi166\